MNLAQRIFQRARRWHTAVVATPLASFLKDRKAASNQVRKFLATSAWLHDTKHLKRLTTKEVTQALSDNNQGRLGNAAQSLINNTTRGMVVKEGRTFDVTDEGREELVK